MEFRSFETFQKMSTAYPIIHRDAKLSVFSFEIDPSWKLWSQSNQWVRPVKVPPLYNGI